MTARSCDRLDEYLLGVLAEDEAATFEAHLAACPECREEAAIQRRIDGLFAEASAALEPVPASLALRLRQEAAGRLRQEPNSGATAGLSGATDGLSGATAGLSGATAGSPGATAGLSSSAPGTFGPRNHGTRRRWLLSAVVLAAAAGLLLAVGLWVIRFAPSAPEEERPIARAPVAPPLAPPSPRVPSRGELPAAPPTRVAMIDPTSGIVVPKESRNPDVAVFFVYRTVKPDRAEPPQN